MIESYEVIRWLCSCCSLLGNAISQGGRYVVLMLLVCSSCRTVLVHETSCRESDDRLQHRQPLHQGGDQRLNLSTML